MEQPHQVREAVLQFQIQQEVNLIQQVRALQIALQLAKEQLSVKSRMFIAEQLILTSQLLTRGLTSAEEEDDDKLPSTN